MPRKITISAGSVSLGAELNDTDTAGAIWDSLPISQPGNTWGDEIYFRIPVKVKPDDPEDLQEVVDFGDLAFWPPGSAFCIFFGPTPASRDDEIRPASAVAVIGQVLGYAAQFRQVGAGTTVTIEQA